jgi:hypothetical protein
LGGTDSSFILDGFNFSKQHDAQFIQENSTTTVISFLDNASAINSEITNPYSSALIVALDMSATPMVARVIQRWVRPDRELSRLRGNFQSLPGGNAFICWSDRSYISEHSSDGRLLFEARFKSDPVATYRAYKFNFTGHPADSPTLTVYNFGTSPRTSTTVGYVSWNGATEVERWNFYRGGDSTVQPQFLGSAAKSSFETIHYFQEYEEWVFAEAIAADGHILGASPAVFTIAFSYWNPKDLFEKQQCKARFFTAQ